MPATETEFVMNSDTLSYQSKSAVGFSPHRRRAALILAWCSIAVGGIAVSCLPMLMLARGSMGGFILAPPVWLLSLFSFTTGVGAVVLRRRGKIGWVGVLLGTITLVFCTAYLFIPSLHEI
jgi:hypothetical protein